MTLEYEVPTSDVTTNWNTGTYADVDDPVGSPDDDTTYAEHSGSNQNLDLETANPTLTDAGSVNSVSVFSRSKYVTTAGKTRCLLYVNGTRYQGSAQTLSTSYQNFTDIFNTNPDTSSAWLVADARGVGSNPYGYIGNRALCDATPQDVRLTQTYAIFDFNEGVSTPLFYFHRTMQGMS